MSAVLTVGMSSDAVESLVGAARPSHRSRSMNPGVRKNDRWRWAPSGGRTAACVAVSMQSDQERTPLPSATGTNDRTANVQRAGTTDARKPTEDATLGWAVPGEDATGNLVPFWIAYKNGRCKFQESSRPGRILGRVRRRWLAIFHVAPNVPPAGGLLSGQYGILIT
jgi:hypothetical protein